MYLHIHSEGFLELFRRLRQEDCEFDTGLGYIVRPCLQKKKYPLKLEAKSSLVSPVCPRVISHMFVCLHWDLDMPLGHCASLLLTLLTGQGPVLCAVPNACLCPASVSTGHICPMGTAPEGTSDSEGAEGSLLPRHVWLLAETATKAPFFFNSRVSFHLERNL